MSNHDPLAWTVGRWIFHYFAVPDRHGALDTQPTTQWAQQPTEHHSNQHIVPQGHPYGRMGGMTTMALTTALPIKDDPSWMMLLVALFAFLLFESNVRGFDIPKQMSCTTGAHRMSDLNDWSSRRSM
jgi:hypothetical protein